MEIHGNPLLRFSTYYRLPNDIKELITDYLVTPNTSIKNLEQSIEWQETLKKICKNPVLEDDLPPRE